MSPELKVDEIRKIVPHRYPFLLIDRVTEIDGDQTIKGYKNISINEPLFNGHFPEKPIFPGVLIIEAMAQLGAVLKLRHVPEDRRMAYFAGIENARFKRLVEPGDRLDLEVRVTRDRGRFVIMQGKATVDGDIAAEATLMSILAE